MIDIVVQALVLCGSIFMLLAGLGVSRMPDLYMRLSTVTKAGTLGLFLLLVGVLIDHFSLTVFLRVLAVLVFALVTAPVSSHVVSRAGYFQGVQLWEGSIRDDLKGRYDEHRHELSSPEPASTTLSDALSEEQAAGAAGPENPQPPDR